MARREKRIRRIDPPVLIFITPANKELENIFFYEIKEDSKVKRKLKTLDQKSFCIKLMATLD